MSGRAREELGSGPTRSDHGDDGGGKGFRTQDAAAGDGHPARSSDLAALTRIGATKYQQIAPDLFPRLCAWALVASGALLLVRGLVRGGEYLGLPKPRGLGLVAAGVVLFGMLAPVAGYAPAGLALMLVSGWAAHDVRPRQLLLVSAGIIAFSVILFSVILKLPLPIARVPGLGS